MKNKIIISFMILSLLISYIFPIISFGKYDNYISLGDSISEGYGLKNKSDDNYTEKLRQKLNISSNNYQNLSVCSETTLKFYETIQTDKYKTAISNADLITITIGSNEILEIVAEIVSYATEVPMTMEDDVFFVSACNAFLDANLLKKIEMLLALYEYLSTEDIYGKIETNIARYEEYWKKSIAYIKKINPDVTIVATEFYNPYYDVTILNYDFGGWCDEIIQKLNTILHAHSKSETEYEIAKIYSTFNTTNPRLTNVNLSLTDFNIDPHPTALGHELISSKILEELSTQITTPNKKDISTLSITDIVDQEYTGKSIEPSISIKDGNSTLVQEEDYTVIYYNNIEVGKASALIMGINDYTGKITKNFNIKNSKRKEISTCQIETIEYQLYLGMKLEPEVVIKDGNKVLQKNTDYTLTYQNNINVGMGSVTITGIGNYIGSTTTTFFIAPMPINLTTINDIPEQLYTGNEITPEIIISFGAVKLIEGTDYTLEYTNNIDNGKATINIKGIGNFTDTTTKKFNIVSTSESTLQNIFKATVSSVSEKTYTGSSITPDITVTLNGKKLEKITDYKTLYSNNIDVGTGIITIVGTGDYTGILETTFKIVPKSIESLSLNDISDKKYSGKPIKPKIILTDNLRTLNENEDYTVTYYNNTDIGVSTIQIYGKGNYTGTLFKTFNIVKPDTPPVEDNTPKPDNSPNNSPSNTPNTTPDNTPSPPPNTTPNNNDNVQKVPGNAIDNTTSSNKIPHAGTHIKFFILILSLLGLSIIFYKSSKRWY